MQTFIDTGSPRHQLRFEDLPRGFVKFPDRIVKGVADLAASHGYGEEYTRQSLVQNTLAWFYEGLPIAYRERPDGIEVLAIGFPEVAPYRRKPQADVHITQPS